MEQGMEEEGERRKSKGEEESGRNSIRSAGLRRTTRSSTFELG